MIARVRFATAVACLTAVVAARAAVEPRYSFQVYGHNEGLENLNVRSILQDRQGFLWVGTNNGLFRFDGERFRAFRVPDGLPDVHIAALQESADGRLWAGTRRGIAYLAGERFVPVQLGDGVAAQGPSAFSSGRDGRFWFAGNRELFFWDTRKSPQAPKFEPAHLPEFAGRLSIRAVLVDSGGAIWFAVGNRLGRLSGEKLELMGPEAGLPDEDWGAILEDGAGRIWVRGRVKMACREKNQDRFRPAGPALPQGGRMESLALAPGGSLVVPTHVGVYLQEGTGWRLVGGRHGLPGESASCVLWDREKSPWIGLESHGVVRWLGYQEWESWTREEGLSNDIVTSVARDPTGALWIGTKFGLNRLAAGSSSVQTWTTRQGLPSDDVRALRVTSDGSLWIGTGGGGLTRMDLGTFRLRRYGAADGLENTRIVSMGRDPDGRLWVSTRHGLYRIDPLEESARFERMPVPLIEPTRTVYGIIYGRHARTWIATTVGLLVSTNGNWVRLTSRDGLRGDQIISLAEEPGGAVWVSYDQPLGVSRVEATSTGFRITHFDQQGALRSGDVSFIGVDFRGRIWVGTDVGVDLYNGAGWRHIGANDGLIWQDTVLGGFFADADGSVWVGTNGGVSHYQPAGFEPALPPPVVVSAVRFGGKPAAPAAALRIPYAQRTLEVDFAALTVKRPKDVRFRYRLVGLHGGWIETGQSRLAFPSLPAGRFRFEVLACSAPGIWSESPAGFDFEILPPWWQTWWAVGLGCVLLGGFFGGIWRWRVNRLLDAKRQLESAVRERTQEIEREKALVVEQKRRIEQLLESAREASRLKGEFLANVSHEIRTPMNGVLGMAALALGTELTAEQRDYLETVRTCAESLLRLLNEILDLSKIEAGRLELEIIEFQVRQCVSRAVRMVEPSARHKAIELAAEIDPRVPATVMGDGGRLEQVLLNLVGNAVKFTDCGKVTVAVELESETPAEATLRFSVTDTGIGVPADKLEVIFEPFQQADGSTTRRYGGTGLGLAICSRLVDLMGGHIGVESEPGRGSRFFFAVRFARSADPAAAGSPAPPGGSAAAGREAAVLVVDDNLVSQRVVAGLLEKRGCRVVAARNGVTALETLERERFDLVLMDVQMPELDGLGATRAIRERENESGSHTPIIMLTASAMAGDHERCLAAGADGFLTKPLEPKRLDALLENLLKQKPGTEYSIPDFPHAEN